MPDRALESSVRGWSVPFASNHVTASAGPFALFTILVLGVVVVLLIINMDRRLKRLPRSFDDIADREADATAEQDTRA
jgi:hypothetical protein